MSRLASGVWVAAYLRRLQAEAIPVYVLARGDETAGAVLVKLTLAGGKAEARTRVLDFETGARRWEVLVAGPEAEIDAAIARQRSRDPDLWVIEVDDKRGRHLLDEPGLGA